MCLGRDTDKQNNPGYDDERELIWRYRYKCIDIDGGPVAVYGVKLGISIKGTV